jgi:hypothetical protein
MLWRRLRRRTMAPSRPAIYPDQLGLVLITIFVIAVGVYVVFRTFTG